MIPDHDLTATLTERDGAATLEVTLTHYPAEYDESDPPLLIFPEKWQFAGDTFPPYDDPEGSPFDAVTTYCIEGSLAMSVEYDGVSTDTSEVTLSPVHAEMSDALGNINLFSRYSSIIIDDPEA
jgi:hypothetical protein